MSKPLANEVERLTRRLARERKSRLNAQAAAKKGLQELHRRRCELQLLEQIATTANSLPSVQATLEFAIEAVCQFTGWFLGHAYLRSDEPGPVKLVSTCIWNAPENKRTAQFRSLTEKIAFRRGKGLPGRVLKTGFPVWIVNVRNDSDFARAPEAAAAGIRSAFAFPILAGSVVVGVLEFFSTRSFEPDDALLHLMAQIGTQLGRAVERKRAEDLLVYEATHDALTNLPNRKFFLDRLRRLIDRKRRSSECDFAVLSIDIDGFKVVNDSLGHLAGDSLIKQVAERLVTVFGTSAASLPERGPVADRDLLAHFGSDEFYILLSRIGDGNDPVRTAERVNGVLKLPFSVEGQDIHVSASIGIVSSSENDLTVSECLRNADLALHRARAAGKARHEVYDTAMHTKALKHFTLTSDLRRALEREEFVLHFQPIVSIDSSEINGFEALVRWQQPGGKLVYPGEFIGLAEETGLVVPLGQWVLQEACKITRKWHETFPGAGLPFVSVNISLRQFMQADLVDQIGAIIRSSGIDPDLLLLEVTESVATADDDRIAGILYRLRELGVHLCIDDFGTGYSSLSRLHSYPVEVLKIDRSFISQSDTPSGKQMIETIVGLARNLRMKVVAEGVESKEQAAHLRSIGCGFCQGYYYSKPVSEAEARGLLATRPPARARHSVHAAASN